MATSDNEVPRQVSFSVSKEDAKTIGAIVARAKALALEHEISTERKFDALSMHMDLTACHANGCPLKLQALLEADNFNFVHDVWGIQRHINRKTGQLEDFFLPRFSQGF